MKLCDVERGTHEVGVQIYFVSQSVIMVACPEVFMLEVQ